MRRPPAFSPETKTRVVLSVLSGEITVAEAARKEWVSEPSIGRGDSRVPRSGQIP